MRLVVAAWIFCDNEVLLIHHRKSGRWLPVGGHVECGEGLMEALAREVREEVGLEIAILSAPPVVPATPPVEDLPLPFRLAEYDRGGGAELTFDFIAAALSKDVRLQESEILDAWWLTLEEIRSSEEYSERLKLLAAEAFRSCEQYLRDA